MAEQSAEGSMAERLAEGSTTESIVREAVAAGMESPLRETILEGVERGEGVPMKPERRLVPALAVVGISFALGYVLGRRAARASGW